MYKEKTPKSLRLHIGIFGRTNVGKSSFLNMVAGQDVAITSALAGTTTDVVEKTMELLPVGPVVFLDTAGFDDGSELGALRIKKTKRIFDRSDVILLILEPDQWQAYEDMILEESRKRGISVIAVINKTDLKSPSEAFIQAVKNKVSHVVLCSSIEVSKRDVFVNALKRAILEIYPDGCLSATSLIGDVVPAGGLVVLIVPIDLEAPKGRLILPQVQTIREILDNDAVVMVVKEREYKSALRMLKGPADMVVCDSQVVSEMVASTPAEVKCTTFSVLFSRYRGDLREAVRGIRAVEALREGDKVLIAEGCSHHPIKDDIGRVKIPRWLREYKGAEFAIDVCAGRDYPECIKEYKLIIHCGGCMLNRKEMLSRIKRAREEEVAITNYGICISYLQGVISRVLSPFPEALDLFNSLGVVGMGEP